MGSIIIIVALIILVVTAFSIESQLKKAVKQNERIIELLEKQNSK
ncbi:uncharacterized protein YoxC [Bacillus fengqiuensis]|nr:uncharacterized protein YoxC [Bacillus fengqiuensis]